MIITKRQIDVTTVVKVKCNPDELIKVLVIDAETEKPVDEAWHYPRGKYTSDDLERFKIER